MNARLNLNEDFNLNDACSLPLDSEDGLTRRDCIDLNLDVSNEDDVGANAGYLGCSGGETLQRECSFDLNVEVCEEVKETQGDANRNGHSEVGDALLGKKGQQQKEEINVNNSSGEDDGVSDNLNHVLDAVKLEVIHVSADHAAKEGSLCLVEENGGDDGKEDAATIAFHEVSNATSVTDSVEVQQMDCPSRWCSHNS